MTLQELRNLIEAPTFLPFLLRNRWPGSRVGMSFAITDPKVVSFLDGGWVFIELPYALLRMGASGLADLEPSPIMDLKSAGPPAHPLARAVESTGFEPSGIIHAVAALPE